MTELEAPVRGAPQVLKGGRNKLQAMVSLECHTDIQPYTDSPVTVSQSAALHAGLARDKWVVRHGEDWFLCRGIEAVCSRCMHNSCELFCARLS